MLAVRARTSMGIVVAAVGFALLAPAGAGSSEAEAPLARRLARALAVPQVSPSRSAALAADLETGEIVFQRHPGLSLAPASTEKLAVSYAALVMLGPSFRIRTPLLGEGEQRGSVWHGRLVLKGYGDPTLSRGDVRYLASRVRAAGVRTVTGGVVGDETFFDARRTAPGWKSYFFLNESPPLSALTVDRARHGGSMSVRPALAAATALAASLRAAGVSVRGAATTGRATGSAVPLASTLSPPLWQLVRFMGRESDNFTAELLVKQLGALYGRGGTTASGAGVITRILAADGIPLAGVRIVDGSGLSRLNRLTVRALGAILATSWQQPVIRKALLASLPLAGKTGTLRHRLRLRPAYGQVHAKTGSTSQSSSLAGFVRDRFVFAVVHNGSPVSHWWARRAQDRFVTALAAAK